MPVAACTGTLCPIWLRLPWHEPQPVPRVLLMLLARFDGVLTGAIPPMPEIPPGPIPVVLPDLPDPMLAGEIAPMPAIPLMLLSPPECPDPDPEELLFPPVLAASAMLPINDRQISKTTVDAVRLTIHFV